MQNLKEYAVYAVNQYNEIVLNEHRPRMNEEEAKKVKLTNREFVGEYYGRQGEAQNVFFN